MIYFSVSDIIREIARLKWARERELLPVGALMPAIPSIDILTLNKCRYDGFFVIDSTTFLCFDFPFFGID